MNVRPSVSMTMVAKLLGGCSVDIEQRMDASHDRGVVFSAKFMRMSEKVFRGVSFCVSKRATGVELWPRSKKMIHTLRELEYSIFFANTEICPDLDVSFFL